jgi:ankyrin repeat protein
VNTELHQAAEHGDFELVKQLVEAGASTISKNVFGLRYFLLISPVDVSRDPEIVAYLKQNMGSNNVARFYIA